MWYSEFVDNQNKPNTLPFQSQTQTPVSPTPNLGKTLLLILLGLIIIAVSIFVGMKIGESQISNQKQIIKQSTLFPKQMVVDQLVIPSTSLEREPNPPANTTADWKTYTNNEAKIFFKYPSNLSISNITQGTGEIIKIIGLEKEILLAVEPTTEHDLYTSKNVSDILLFNNISWSHLTGDIQYCDGGECGSISDALRTTTQGRRYTFILGRIKYPDDILNQILSTFTFIE